MERGKWEALEADHVGDERPGRASSVPVDCCGGSFGKQSKTVHVLSGCIYFIFVFSKYSFTLDLKTPTPRKVQRLSFGQVHAHQLLSGLPRAGFTELMMQTCI